ncbi:anthranilate synthase component II [Candidatus Paracaedibacter symbiosus]|uniref:anthranilate synthase component II n=1 Tax=Candidatus Paracaedibacter symbiosus TaxID=244582 RepID=UPI0005097DCC|nr:aminodeoxychorismate/anthranilate synthase component II [Candidatus Paracaedibacter symbiosus]
MILMIDNYDSFVFNLVRYGRELGAEMWVRRNDEVTVAEIEVMNPSHIMISPGPCSPKEAGISPMVIEKFAGRIPLFGVCLGHQAIGHVFGGEVVRAQKPIHGKVMPIHHQAAGLFQGLPSPMQVTRYHSLVVARESLPQDLLITAESATGEIMALTHRTLPIVGVQFHPEAVLSEYGHALMRNFLEGNYR